MPHDVSKLLKEALALPVEERAGLADSLLKSLDQISVTDAFMESMRGSLAERGT